MSTQQQPKYHKVNRRFTPKEDEHLRELVKKFGEKNWLMVSTAMKTRNSRQCKDRWFQYLSPNANLNPWTKEEEERLKQLIIQLNGKWFEIAKYFPGRSDSQVRNKWRTIQRKMGLIDQDVKGFIDAISSQMPKSIPLPIFNTPHSKEETNTTKQDQPYIFGEDVFAFDLYENPELWLDEQPEQISLA